MEAMGWFMKSLMPNVLYDFAHTPDLHGGFLADGMGLGKTVTMLALIAAYPGNTSTLVVCPPNILGQWEREIREKTTLSVSKFYKHQRHIDATHTNVILTTYSTLQQALKSGQTSSFPTCWHRIVLDESHTMTSGFVDVLPKSRILWCVTATPEKNLDRQLKALGIESMKNGYGTQGFAGFQLMQRTMDSEDICTPPMREECVSVCLNPLDTYHTLYRRTREAVVQRPHWKCGSSILQPLRYFLSCGKMMKGALLDTGRGQEFEKPCSPLYAPDDDQCPICIDTYQDPVMTQCNHWFCRQCLMDVKLSHKKECPLCRRKLGKVYLGKHRANEDQQETHEEEEEEEETAPPPEQDDIPSAKITVAMTKLGKKTLVFSEYMDTLKSMAAILKDQNIQYRIVLGNVKNEKAFCDFQTDPECTVLLLNLKTAAVGITLTAADTVLFMEPCWEPVVRKQAIGRAVRHGNISDMVTIVNMVYDQTVETDLYRYIKNATHPPTSTEIKLFMSSNI